MSDNVHVLHRPLAWQGSLWASLIDALHKDHLPHGLLLYGHNGVGKLHFAKAMANYLLCASPTGNEACGQCHACLLNKAGSHPDLFLAQPEEPGKAIKVDLIRELNKFVAQTSQMSGRKVVIIEPADAMNINSSNALLKTLEEPSGDTHLILVVDSISSLMATIRSRCQYYEVPAPSAQQTKQYLSERFPERNDIDFLSDISGGGPFYAIDLVDSGKLAWRSLISDGLMAVAKGESSALVAEQWKSIEIMEALHWLQLWVEDMVRVLMTQNLELTSSVDLKPLLQMMLDKPVDPRYVLRFREIILEMMDAAIHSHPNKQLVYDRLLIDWKTLFSAK